jgi:putative redox protein
LDAKVKWHGGLSFNGTAETGFSVPLGASPSVGGENDGFRPMELLATGLAGCTAMDVMSILLKKREQVTDFEVAVNTERADRHPKVFTRALIEFFVTGNNVSEDSVLRAIELSAEIYCPAQAMFKQLMPVEIKYAIYENKGEGKRSLVTSGTYVPD